MARLREIELSTATLGEKKANVKRQIVFVLLLRFHGGNSGTDISKNK
jgi:hypothetical protein